MRSKLSPPTFTPRLRAVPRHVGVMAVIALVLALTAGALWAAPVITGQKAKPLAGTVRIVGSRDAAAPVSRWASILKRDHPDVHVVTMLYGSGTGAGALADGEADLVPMFRTLRPNEREMIVASEGPPQSAAVAMSPANDRTLRLYYKPFGDTRSDRIAAEFVHIALSREGRAALAPTP